MEPEEKVDVLDKDLERPHRIKERILMSIVIVQILIILILGASILFISKLT